MKKSKLEEQQRKEKAELMKRRIQEDMKAAIESQVEAFRKLCARYSCSIDIDKQLHQQKMNKCLQELKHTGIVQ
ncbi:hypothetical protein K1719_041038 [Acacia pycnantha]|nr:hypothetical protein K1719_041038 [Acacia pycnantha]